MAIRSAIDGGELRTIVRSIPYFDGLPAEQIDQMAALARVVDFAKGEVIFSQGEPAQGLCFVVSGKVKAVRYSAEGKEFIIRLFSAGETFNEVGVLDGGVNPATAIAVEDSRILFLPVAEMKQLLENNVALDTRIMKAMAQKLRFAMRQVGQLSLLDVKGRLARFLLDQWRGGHAECLLSQEEMAAMLGTVRQVLGRALADMQAQGAVETGRGRVRVLDPELLANMVEPE